MSFAVAYGDCSWNRLEYCSVRERTIGLLIDFSVHTHVLRKSRKGKIPMKIRKLWASLAAVAMTVAGLAVGATTANAADEILNDSQTVTFTASSADQLSGRTLSAYKLANYTTGSNKISVSDNARAAITLALSEIFPDDAKTLQSDDVSDPLLWVLVKGKLDDAAMRQLANALEEDVELLGTATTVTLSNVTGSGNSWQSTVTLPAGWYLFVDNNSDAGKTPSQAMIVGTLWDKMADSGTVNLKAEDFVKTADRLNVSVGDEVHYTLKNFNVPNLAGVAEQDFFYRIYDYPSKGLTVDTATVKVFIDGKELPRTEYWVTPANVVGTREVGAEVKESADAYFTIDLTTYLFNNWSNNLEGQPIVITYTGTVNDEISSNRGEYAENEAWLDNSGRKTPHYKYKVYTGHFSFTKVDANGRTLNGAKFTVQFTDAADNSTEADKANVGKWLGEQDDNGNWTFIDRDGKPYEFESEDGVFTFEGLAPGTYVVTETQQPEGFLGIMASFTITITNTTEDSDNSTFTMKGNNDIWGLVNGTDQTVKNLTVPNLPKTGAGGIAIFSVIALLVAGAALAVGFKARDAKRMFNR